MCPILIERKTNSFYLRGLIENAEQDVSKVLSAEKSKSLKDSLFTFLDSTERRKKRL